MDKATRPLHGARQRGWVRSHSPPGSSLNSRQTPLGIPGGWPEPPCARGRDIMLLGDSDALTRHQVRQPLHSYTLSHQSFCVRAGQFFPLIIWPFWRMELGHWVWVRFSELQTEKGKMPCKCFQCLAGSLLLRRTCSHTNQTGCLIGVGQREQILRNFSLISVSQQPASELATSRLRPPDIILPPLDFVIFHLQLVVYPFLRYCI